MLNGHKYQKVNGLRLQKIKKNYVSLNLKQKPFIKYKFSKMTYTTNLLSITLRSGQPLKNQI